MKCKYMKPKINKGVWCTRDDKRCTNCNHKEYDLKKSGFQKKSPVKKQIKKKSKELSKLERNRFSILTNDLNHCIICGKSKEHLHEVFFGASRQRSMEYGTIIPLCSKCHSEMHRNKEWQDYWHKFAQKRFLEHYHKDLNEFIDIFKKNYL